LREKKVAVCKIHNLSSNIDLLPCIKKQ